jgi:ATP-dependent Clp protease ATP-binding subunit ClpA
MSLVENIGFDGSGVHSGFEINYDILLMKDKISNFTKDIKENELMKIELERFFNSYNNKEFINRFKRIFSYSPLEILNKIKSKFK